MPSVRGHDPGRAPRSRELRSRAAWNEAVGSAAGELPPPGRRGGNTRNEVDTYPATVDRPGAILGRAPILGAWSEPSVIAHYTGRVRAARAVHGVVFRPFFGRDKENHAKPLDAG